VISSLNIGVHFVERKKKTLSNPYHQQQHLKQNMLRLITLTKRERQLTTVKQVV
jgi:hypothetical protein